MAFQFCDADVTAFLRAGITFIIVFLFTICKQGYSFCGVLEASDLIACCSRTAAASGDGAQDL